MFKAAIITASDKGAQGLREDLSGPCIKKILEEANYEVVSIDILPDDRILTLDMPSRKAVMVFAIPESIYSGLSVLNRNVRFYPTSYMLIDRISSIADNNRLLVSYSLNELRPSIPTIEIYITYIARASFSKTISPLWN